MEMKFNPSYSIALLLLAIAVNTSATLRYVNVNSTNPTRPYTNWVTAATNIQDAVAVAAAGDTVLVADGVYPGSVTVTKPLALASVNGPQFTVIDGCSA